MESRSQLCGCGLVLVAANGWVTGFRSSLLSLVVCIIIASNSCREPKKKKNADVKSVDRFPQTQVQCEAPGRVIALDLIRINFPWEMH